MEYTAAAVPWWLVGGLVVAVIVMAIFRKKAQSRK